MTLEKAIEILNLGHAGVISIQSKDYQDALQLGLDALKFMKGLHDTGAMPNNARLPGETPEK